MAIPQVVCSSDVVLDYDSSPRLVQLGATAALGPITDWHWTILSVPPGSQAHVGAKGDFINGVAIVQNPQLEIDAGIDGGYTLQCVATNADGSSDPFADRREGQQAIIVRTQSRRLWLPGDYLYDWGERYVNPTLRLIEASLGAGGLLPFWTWGGSLDEFTVVNGAAASNWSADVYNYADTTWLGVSLNGDNNGNDLRDWTVLFLATGANPPSANYFVVADILIPSMNGSFGCVGARCAMPGSYPIGYLGLLFSGYGEGDPAYFQAYHFSDGSYATVPYTSQEQGELTTNLYSVPRGARYMIGAKGEGIEGPFVAVHSRARTHVIDMSYFKEEIFDANYPAVGVGLTSPAGSAQFFFSNIRAYAFPASGNSISAGDWY